ncbi:ABC transporter C family member 8-like protein [Tanacetum coccineum]|uniref:ABC transporter C family member 8-like protein n=1 Tax=Tanacetum coccineum TaxID=301880 RepID=A0ABQ4YZA2_9ASTR
MTKIKILDASGPLGLPTLLGGASDTTPKTKKKVQKEYDQSFYKGAVLQAETQLYHLYEDISNCEEYDENGDAILRTAESSRTIIEIGLSALQAAASYWLAFAVKIPKYTSVTLIGVYALISTTSAFFVFLRSIFTTLLGLKASKAFFSKFTELIFCAPMLFFDSTPVGRILTRVSFNRFECSGLRHTLFIYFVVTSAIELVTIIIVMASVTWQVLIVGIFATIATKYFQGYYQPSARELIRINGTTKALVVNYASETSLGVATIRAFKKENMFFNNYLKLVDVDARAFIFTNATLEWLVLRAEALQNLTLFTAAFFLVLLPKGYIPPVGLSLSYALALTNAHVFLTRWYCSLANYVISVERIKQYMHIPPEPPAVVEKNRPPSSWSSKCRIELKDVKVS